MLDSHGITSQTERDGHPQPDPDDHPPSALIACDLDHPMGVETLDDTEDYSADEVCGE